MPLVKAQCTNCNGMLEVDPSKDAAICPHCGTPYVVEKAINQYQTIHDHHVENHTVNNIAEANISMGMLDADTMFKNWLVTRDSQLAKDFRYYYATDGRWQYMCAFGDGKHMNLKEVRDKALKYVPEPYLQKELAYLDELEKEREEDARKHREEWQRREEQTRKRIAEEKRAKEEEEKQEKANMSIAPALTIISAVIVIISATHGSDAVGYVFLGLTVLFGFIWFIQNQFYKH